MNRRPSAAGFTLAEILVAVVIIGMLAAVAGVAWGRYVRRIKSAEAAINVRKMFDISVAYYEAEHAAPSAAILPRQFPASVGWTPGEPGVCCKGAQHKCPPGQVKGTWDDPSWVALQFSIEEPFYFSYQYDAGGTGAAAHFTASGGGDLVCDEGGNNGNGNGNGKGNGHGNVTSLFQRVGWIQGGNVTGGALYTSNETE